MIALCETCGYRFERIDTKLMSVLLELGVKVPFSLHCPICGTNTAYDLNELSHFVLSNGEII